LTILTRATEAPKRSPESFAKLQPMEKSANYAFIDSQNLHLAIQGQGWNLDYKKFRVYLKEKHNVETAYIFIGYVPENATLYTSLQSFGFVVVFRPTLKNSEGVIKGNCDAELVLQAMIDFEKYKQAIIVSGDGDFHCLVKYLREQGKLKCVLVPDMRRYSILLNKAAEKHLAFMNNLRTKLEYKRLPHKKKRTS